VGACIFWNGWLSVTYKGKKRRVQMRKLLCPPPLAVEDPCNVVEESGGEVQPKAASVSKAT
jgi:hypothetical protein